jgi:hypothetical protein
MNGSFDTLKSLFLSLQNLSLRSSQIDDEKAEAISYALGGLKRQNKKLLTLNLNSNKIADKGAIALARVFLFKFDLLNQNQFFIGFYKSFKALRTNRTLLSLSLANNNIGDDGAKALSDVISRFQLKHEEILHRRNIISGRTDMDKSVVNLYIYYNRSIKFEVCFICAVSYRHQVDVLEMNRKNVQIVRRALLHQHYQIPKAKEKRLQKKNQVQMRLLTHQIQIPMHRAQLQL